MSRSVTSGQRRSTGSPLACTLGHAATFVVNALLHWWWVRSTKTHEPFLFAPSYQRRAWGSTNSKHRCSRNRYDPNGHQGLREGGTGGTSYPGLLGTGARQDKTTNSQFSWRNPRLMVAFSNCRAGRWKLWPVFFLRSLQMWNCLKCSFNENCASLQHLKAVPTSQTTLCVPLVVCDVLPGGMRVTYLGLLKTKQNNSKWTWRIFQSAL